MRYSTIDYDAIIGEEVCMADGKVTTLYVDLTEEWQGLCDVWFLNHKEGYVHWMILRFHVGFFHLLSKEEFNLQDLDYKQFTSFSCNEWL